MVAGPQVGYFNPQILMEQDVHAPGGRRRAGDRRPGRLVRRHQPLRPARPRARLRVERDLRRPGHHRHVRARALRRHALPLPRPLRADRGAREDQPLGARRSADQTAPGSQTLRAERTKLGLVAGRGKVRGKPVIFTKLRSTYFHEVDSAAGFMDFNTPEVVATPRPSSARRRRSATRSTGSTPTPSTSRTSTRARTRCARRASTTTSRSRRSSSGRAGTRTPGRRASPPFDAAPAGRRPGLLRQLEQQAGARPTAPPTTTPTPRPTAPCCSRTASRRGSRARAS